MKKQISNKELQEILKQYDDNYVVQLGIGEESDLLTHLFIDSDNGVIELTNYEDEVETQLHIIDALKNNVYKDDKILLCLCGGENNIKKGIITDIKPTLLDNEQYLEYSVKILDNAKPEISITFAAKVGSMSNLIKFNW